MTLICDKYVRYNLDLPPTFISWSLGIVQKISTRIFAYFIEYRNRSEWYIK